MSSNGKGRNARNTSVNESTSNVEDAVESPTASTSIIRTRHQTVQDANPGREIRRRPTPGIEILTKKNKNDAPSPRTKSSKPNKINSGKEESEDEVTPRSRRSSQDEVTPRRGRSSQDIPKETSQKTPKEATIKKTPKQDPKPKNASNDKKTDIQDSSESVKRGRGRPRKIIAENEKISDYESEDEQENKASTFQKIGNRRNSINDKLNLKTTKLSSSQSDVSKNCDAKDEIPQIITRETRRKSLDGEEEKITRSKVKSEIEDKKESPRVTPKDGLKKATQRKIPTLDSEGKQTEGSSEAVKRGRGRPKKIISGDENVSEEESEEAPNSSFEIVKRGRGRPRKVISGNEAVTKEESLSEAKIQSRVSLGHSTEEQMDHKAKLSDSGNVPNEEIPHILTRRKSVDDELIDIEPATKAVETRGRPRKSKPIENITELNKSHNALTVFGRDTKTPTTIAVNKTSAAEELTVGKSGTSNKSKAILFQQEGIKVFQKESPTERLQGVYSKTLLSKTRLPGLKSLPSNSTSSMVSHLLTPLAKSLISQRASPVVQTTPGNSACFPSENMVLPKENKKYEQYGPMSRGQSSEERSEISMDTEDVSTLVKEDSASENNDSFSKLEKMDTDESNVEEDYSSYLIDPVTGALPGLIDPVTGTISGEDPIPTTTERKDASTLMLDILASACLSQSQPTSTIQTSTNILASAGLSHPQSTSTLQTSTASRPDMVCAKEPAPELSQIPNDTMEKLTLQTAEDAVFISPEAVPLSKDSSLVQPLTPTFVPLVHQSTVDVISVVNASLENESENTWSMSQLINLFIQWQNTDAMCWLDVVLAVLAHSPTLQEKAKIWTSSHKGNDSQTKTASDSQQNSVSDINVNTHDEDVTDCVESILNKVCESVTGTLENSISEVKPKESFELIKIAGETETNAGVQNISVKEEGSKKSKLKFPVIITLIKAHEQAQYLLQNFLIKPQTKSDTITQEGDLVCQTSSNPQTGAGIKIISPLLTMLHKQSEGGLPMDALTHLGESIAKLEDVREVVWDILQPRLKCEKGKNDSPVFALPLLVRESQELKHMFSIEYSLVFHCSKCDYRQENKFVKALPSLPIVPLDFSMTEPAFVRNCFRCEDPGQKMVMKIHSMQDIAMLHFLHGLPKVVYEELDFSFGDNTYRVTAVIQYKNNPDHFVAWIRKPHGNQWMECDDLKSPLCQYENAPPRIPPEQIHIVMWEKNLSKTQARIRENSRTAGLLSSLLMSTRMVTMSSEGNSKVLTTIPIQYTPVTTVGNTKRKTELILSSPQITNKVIMYPALASRPNIISQPKGVSPVSIVPVQQVNPQDNFAPLPESIQNVIDQSKASTGTRQEISTTPAQTRVVIVGPKQNQVLPGTLASSEMKTVSIGGRIVRLTAEQLNAIRNSPGARVSIVGADGTTTFSIKGLQNRKKAPEAASPAISVKPPKKLIVQAPTTKSITVSFSSSGNNQLSSQYEQPVVTSQPILTTEHNILTQTTSTDVMQSVATSTQNLESMVSIPDVTSSIVSVSNQEPSKTTWTGPNKPRIVVKKTASLLSQPSLPSRAGLLTTNTGSNFSFADGPVDPQTPCRIVVDGNGQVTAIANKDNTKFIPLTNNKDVNRAILQKFFAHGDGVSNTNSIVIQNRETANETSNLKSVLQTQPASTSIATVPRVSHSTSASTMTSIQEVPSTPSTIYVQNRHQDVSSLETAMAVDSISSPQSRHGFPTYQTQLPLRGAGSRGGKTRGTAKGRGRGRGQPAITLKHGTEIGKVKPITVSTVQTGNQTTVSGRQIYATPRKVAIPTNNGHILIDVPAGRSVMDCLRDHDVVKTLVRKIPESSSSDLSSPLPPRVPVDVGRQSSSTTLNSELIQHLKGKSTPNSNIRSISVPRSQEDRIREILGHNTSFLSNPSSVCVQQVTRHLDGTEILTEEPCPVQEAQTDVLSAALFESGVQDMASYSDVSQSVIVQGIPQTGTDHFATHGLDILSQGVAAATQSQAEQLLQQVMDSTVNEPQGISLLTQAMSSANQIHTATLDNQSKSFDIFTQGMLPDSSSETLVENTITPSIESQAMSILTGGITSQPPPSQALDILTQGVNPPPVSQSHSLDILTQGITPRIQPKATLQTELTQTITSQIQPTINLFPSKGNVLKVPGQNQSTASMKIGNIGATSGRNQPIIITPTCRSRVLSHTSPKQGPKVYTIKTNGSRSSEIVENPSAQSGLINSNIQTGSSRINILPGANSSQRVITTSNPSASLQSEVFTAMLSPNKEVVINPLQTVKRKAPNQFINVVKKPKTSDMFVQGQVSQPIGNQNVQTLYAEQPSITTEYVLGDSNINYTQDNSMPMENEALSSEYMTQTATSSTGSIAMVDEDKNIFSKFGMTSLGTIDPREAEVLRHLYEVVSSSGSVVDTGTTSLTTDSIANQIGYSPATSELPSNSGVETNYVTNQYVMATEDGTMATDQYVMTTADGTMVTADQLMATDQLVMSTGDGTMATDEIIMRSGVDTMVACDGVSYVAMSDNVVALPINEEYEQNYQQVLFEEEVVSVAENVEI